MKKINALGNVVKFLEENRKIKDLMKVIKNDELLESVLNYLTKLELLNIPIAVEVLANNFLLKASEPSDREDFNKVCSLWAATLLDKIDDIEFIITNIKFFKEAVRLLKFTPSTELEESQRQLIKEAAKCLIELISLNLEKFDCFISAVSIFNTFVMTDLSTGESKI